MAKINQKSTKGALDINNSELVNQLCDAVFLKLTQRLKQHLTFNQGVGSSSLPRPTKATGQDSPPDSWKNQGVRTPGQPTP